MSAFGDSFVWGDEVPPADGWIEQLSRQLAVASRTMASADMAQIKHTFAFVVWNMTAHRSCFSAFFPMILYAPSINSEPSSPLGWSRFGLRAGSSSTRNGQLQWIARPHLDANSYLDLIRNPKAFLPHEYFLPDTRDGPVSVHFPTRWSLARLALMPRLWNRLRGKRHGVIFIAQTIHRALCH